MWSVNVYILFDFDCTNYLNGDVGLRNKKVIVEFLEIYFLISRVPMKIYQIIGVCILSYIIYLLELLINRIYIPTYYKILTISELQVGVWTKLGRYCYFVSHFFACLSFVSTRNLVCKFWTSSITVPVLDRTEVLLQSVSSENSFHKEVSTYLRKLLWFFESGEMVK